MNKWNLCEGNLTLINFESQNEIIADGFQLAKGIFPVTTNTGKFYKPKRKGSEKTSLKKLSPIKPKCKTNQQYPLSKNSQHNKQELRLASNHALCFQSKSQIASPRIVLQKKEQRFQHYPIPSYRLSPSFERVSAVQKVKVNFIKPPFNPETSHPYQIRHYNEEKVIKRMNSTPQKIYNEFFARSIHFGSKMQRLGLAKSMNDNKNVQLAIESKNLDEMKYIKAESLPDSQEDRDEFSIVLSPIELDGENINKTYSWANWNIVDGEINEVSTPQTLESEPILHL